ncbi:MAG: class I tRNA ligase family protein, partial [Chloroflexota bacterium]
QIDIHGGGNDLVFPHHENEIAQTESFTGKPFARYWMHNGMMQFSGEKMSKSIGNLITIADFLAQNEADVLRMMVLNSNYRHPLTFGEDVIMQSKRALDRLRGALKPAQEKAKGISGDDLAAIESQVESTRQGFHDSMDDDFNSASALGYIFELVRAINQARDGGASAEQLEPAQTLLLKLSSILGLQLDQQTEHSAEAAPFVELLLALREKMRADKQWEMSDLIRDQLAELGVILEDSSEGTTWRWQ